MKEEEFIKTLSEIDICSKNDDRKGIYDKARLLLDRLKDGEVTNLQMSKKGFEDAINEIISYAEYNDYERITQITYSLCWRIDRDFWYILEKKKESRIAEENKFNLV